MIFRPMRAVYTKQMVDALMKNGLHSALVLSSISKTITEHLISSRPTLLNRLRLSTTKLSVRLQRTRSYEEW